MCSGQLAKPEGFDRVFLTDIFLKGKAGEVVTELVHEVER
jgi:hypothetical protein